MKGKILSIVIMSLISLLILPTNGFCKADQHKNQLGACSDILIKFGPEIEGNVVDGVYFVDNTVNVKQSKMVDTQEGPLVTYAFTPIDCSKPISFDAHAWATYFEKLYSGKVHVETSDDMTVFVPMYPEN